MGQKASPKSYFAKKVHPLWMVANVIPGYMLLLGPGIADSRVMLTAAYRIYSSQVLPIHNYRDCFTSETKKSILRYMFD